MAAEVYRLIADAYDRRMTRSAAVAGSLRAGAMLLVMLTTALAACSHSQVRPAAFPDTSAIRMTPRDAALTASLRSYYQQWRGVPYRYGGRDQDGIDCSSFVRQTLDSVESLDLPRTTAAQARRGQAIDRGELAPGDLVFFRTGGYRHVGIYVGAGRFMHASSSHGVTISRLDSRYWRRHYWQSRRVTTAAR